MRHSKHPTTDKAQPQSEQMFDIFENMFYPLPMSEKSNVSELPDTPGPHGLTGRQLKILEAIKSAVETQGYPPTMRELGAAAGLTSTASVSYQLESLEKKGFIRRDESKGRALELTPEVNGAPVDKTRMIPLVGRIAAGGPITAEQEVEEVFPLPESFVGKGEL